MAGFIFEQKKHKMTSVQLSMHGNGKKSISILIVEKYIALRITLKR